MVLKAGQGQGTPADRGILSNVLHSDGRHHDLLFVDGGPSSTRTSGLLRMQGKEVFKHAVTKRADVVGEGLQAAGLTTGDVDWIVPHQANRRIIDAAAQRMGLAPEKVMINIDRCANTTAATIPIALSEAVNEGRLQAGDLLLMTGVGGGLTWGGVLFRWGN